MSYDKLREALEAMWKKVNKRNEGSYDEGYADGIECALNNLDELDDQPRVEAMGMEEREVIAFVKGAKYWEYHSTGGTMWQSDQALVVQEAERRYGYNAMKEE